MRQHTLNLQEQLFDSSQRLRNWLDIFFFPLLRLYINWSNELFGGVSDEEKSTEISMYLSK